MSLLLKRTLPHVLMTIFGMLILLIIPFQISEVTDTNAGPRFFPYVLAILITICSGSIVISEFIKNRTQVSNVKSGEFKNKRNFKSVVLIVLSLGLWALLLESLGFIISTFFLMVTLMVLIGSKKKSNIIFVSLVFTVILYSLNRFVIKIYLPEGLFL
ncbi:tripartite tricarboxylate transporter TctB family protein [Bacillus sp. Marseille-P3661]|uniref:tripartite tricarboxylate transporter TctB family protein n=1 Tax=Bacillus sp. Marseille-P3661 TaxID=1936234 RepID=UPI000C85156C|nr:tripartite tricarboxylate transporter TctB family protein [Bacillus sp. Marseille-P3661]